jgi:hypothetical protein
MRKLALALCFLPVVTFAWSGDGHIQIADIAWTKLTPAAQARLTTILNAGEPTFRPFDKNTRNAFRQSANFADYIKGNKKSIYEDTIVTMNRRFEPEIESTGREGDRCKTWHYYDVPIRYKGTMPSIRPSNALVALNLAITELTKLERSPSSDLKMECWWLYWIEHVVGDLHQPLHCVSSHEVHAEGDDGGNKFDIKAPDQDRKIRLHGFWDGAIGRAIGREREAGLSPSVEDVTARWMLEANLRPATNLIKNLNVMGWIKDGAAKADKSVYTGITEGQVPSEAYIKAQVELSKKQAVLAGYRLAEVLNRALK